jgi:hypothetical protein
VPGSDHQPAAVLCAIVAATSGMTLISIEVDHGWDFVALPPNEQHPASPKKINLNHFQ